MGTRSFRDPEQSHEEFLRRTLVSILAHADLSIWSRLHQSGAILRTLARAWLGTPALRNRPRISVPHLCRNVVAIRRATVLLLPASCQLCDVHLYAAEVNVRHTLE